MKCHDLSCFVMRCHEPLRRPRRSFVRSCPACRSSSRFRPVPATGLPAAGLYFRAYHMCAIRRARQTRGPRLLSVPLEFFRAGAKQEAKRPADAASTCPILPRIFRYQGRFGNYFIEHEQFDSPPSERVRRRTGPRALNVQVGDLEGVVLDEGAAGLYAVAHQGREQLARLLSVVHPHLQDRARLRVERRFPELFRVHLAEPQRLGCRDPPKCDCPMCLHSAPTS